MKTSLEQFVLSMSNNLSYVDESTFDSLIEKVDEESSDYISYNSSFYVDGKKYDVTYRDYMLVSVADAIGNWQVFRTFQFRFFKRRWSLHFDFKEVAQEWCYGSIKFLLRRSYWNKKCGIFNFKSPMRLHHDTLNVLEGNNWIIDAPSIYINNIAEGAFGSLRKYYKSGFESEYGNDSCNSILNFATSEVGEFMFKCGYKDLFYKLCSGELSNRISDIKKFFGSIKVAHRHKYDFSSNIITWLDMVSYMDRLNMDIRNPHFICPLNLNEQHNIVVGRFRKNMEKMDARRRALAALKDEDFYHNTHKAYIGIVFGDDSSNLHFHVIESAAEMVDEGEKMHHCVGMYVRREDSLILSCRDNNGNRIATIEVDLRNFSIVQIQGPCNTMPNQYDSINSMVKSNIDLFKNAKRNVKNKFSAAA